MKYPSHLLKLINVLKRFPGVGNKSAERFAFHILNWPEEYLHEMGEIIASSKEKLTLCNACGCLMDNNQCFFCNTSRDEHILCIIASPREVFSIEDTRQYKGVYHVLGGLLSPLENRGPDRLSLKKLKERILALGVKEVIIALDSTIEGDATALYIKHELQTIPLQISRLAFGLPMGSSLEYIDEGTLTRAFVGRNQF